MFDDKDFNSISVTQVVLHKSSKPISNSLYLILVPIILVPRTFLYFYSLSRRNGRRLGTGKQLDKKSKVSTTTKIHKISN